MPIYYYDIPDVMCGNCTGTIERALHADPFFTTQTYGADPIEKRLTLTLTDEHLTYQDVFQRLHPLLDGVGYSCVMVDEVLQQKPHTPPIQHKIADAPVLSKLDPSIPSPQSDTTWFSHYKLGALGIAVGVLLMIGMGAMGAWPLIVQGGIAAVSIVLTGFLGAESYQKAWKKWKTGKLTMDSLFAMSSVTIVLVSSAAFFFPTLPMMFEASLLIFGFRHVGLGIEEGFARAEKMTARFQDDAPEKVWVRINGLKRLIALSQVKPGDELELSEGDMIPLDGVFERGEGQISDQIVTGSIQPRRMIPGEHVYAGTRLIQARGPLIFRVKSGLADSHLARLDAKVKRAKLEKAPLEAATSRIIQYFIPGVLALAIVSGVLIGFLFSVALGIQCAVSVLVSACPCTLGLITPLAVKIAMRKTAVDGGVVFNSAKKLEAADNIQCVVFDLNGTLTLGKPRIARFRALAQSGLSDDGLLDLWANFEQNSSHPVAKAIVDAARVRSAHSPATVQAVDHAGLVVSWANQTYTLGSEAMMTAHGVHASTLTTLRAQIRPQAGESVVYLARAGVVIGYVVVHDPLREDAAQVVSTLKAMGKQVHLCTGADHQTALLYAGLLGIVPEHVRANCVSYANNGSLQSKKQYVDELRAKGYRIATVGDAGNDAEMIAASDVGFAMQSDAANEQTQREAAAVIQGHALFPVVHALSVAQHMVTNIKQNLMFSLIYNVATVLVTGGLFLTWGVALPPALGAFLMIAQTSLILLNVRRFATQPEMKAVTPAVELDASLRHVNRQVDAMCSLLTLKPACALSARDRNADVSGLRDGMRLTHANSQGRDQGKSLFNQRGNLLCDRLNQDEGIQFNERHDVLAEACVVNRIG